MKDLLIDVLGFVVVDVLVFVLVDELSFVLIDVLVVVQCHWYLSRYSVMPLSKHLFVSLSNKILSI